MATAYGSAVSGALAELIKLLREEQGLSQEALADRADLHRTHISLVERGQRGLTVAAAAAVASALGLTVSDLVKRAEQRLPPT